MEYKLLFSAHIYHLVLLETPLKITIARITFSPPNILSP